MKRFICIHGHFYQPPRENPWLEAIELQESAYPYHDWNERICAECYAPNSASRILDGEGKIVEIANNYAKISFNFGPTLLSWLQENEPEVYAAILKADQQSQERFSGHGSALAQIYNHLIMPLANPRDKETQILWGLADFESRFKRKPEGMWLSETAVDLETLELLAAHGLRFTLLSPYQARRVREGDEAEWLELEAGAIDPGKAYRIRLPSGRDFTLFFYDGPISRALAFEGLLSKGENLAQRLLSAFPAQEEAPRLVHIATDGESYGHHHRFGDMALAFALRSLEQNPEVQLTNYGEFLDAHPPIAEVEIHENTAWSCSHGVERWNGDCGCCSGGKPGWKQAWRGPLRQSLDWLRDSLAEPYERRAKELFKDPWRAREAYIRVLLDRSPANVDWFLADQGSRALGGEEQVRALKLLELQRHAMLMYTSCGWFFDELSGIETVQVIQYAGRTLQLAEETLGLSLEGEFLDRLEKAPSNLPELENGRTVYERFVKPARVDLAKVGAHYALSSLFEDYGDETRIYSYQVRREDYQKLEAGKTRCAVGRARFTSDITREQATLSFGVLHFGDPNLNGAVRAYEGEEAYQALKAELSATFERADFPEFIRLLDKHFGNSTYNLISLFKDEQHRVLESILRSSLEEVETFHSTLYEHDAPLIRFLAELKLRIPPPLQDLAQHVLNTRLRQALNRRPLEPEAVHALLEEAKLCKAELDASGLGFALQKAVESIAFDFSRAPEDISLLKQWNAATGLIQELSFNANLWSAQNLFYRLSRSVYPARRAASDREWVEEFSALGEKLQVRLPA